MTDPSFAFNFMSSLAFALGIAVGITHLIRTFRSVPPPHEKYATKLELQRVQSSAATVRHETDHRFGSTINELRSGLNALRSETESRDAALHQRINLILAKVSELEGRCSAKQCGVGGRS